VQSSTKVGANSNIATGMLLVEERNLNLIGVKEVDASESTEFGVATDPKRRNGCSRQAECTGKDAELVITDWEVHVTTSIFETILCPYEAKGPAKCARRTWSKISRSPA
jgi:hypothetical protein